MRDLTPRHRPSKDETLLIMALAKARRATCIRRQVGCILVDVHGDDLATGYNGPPRGWPHCIEQPCPGASAPSGSSLDVCEGIHAEANALIQCPDPYAVHTAYCTDSPCVNCVKLLLNTSCQRIVYLREYPHQESFERWTRHPVIIHGVSVQRTWERFPDADRLLKFAEVI